MKLRKIAKILGGVFALIIIALLTIPLFISSDFLKAQLVSQVKKTTGRTLEIQGDTSLRLFPVLAVSAEDVTLGNPPGFSSQFLVHIDKLETGVALVPLLSGQVHITGITLDGATVNLEKNEHGTENWDFGKASAVPAEGEKKRSDSKSSAAGFSMGDVKISGGAVTYSVHGEAPIAASEINVAIRGADGMSALVVDGDARYQGERVKLRLRLESLKQALAGEMSDVTAALEVPSGRVEYNGAAALAAEGPMLKGSLEASVASLPAVMTWAKGIPPAGTLPKQVELKTDLAMAGMGSIDLAGLTATVDGVRAEGKLAVNLAGAVPSVKGALQIGELDLAAFGGGQKQAEAAAASGGDTSTAASNAGWSDARIDLSGLRAVTAVLDLKLDAVKAGSFAAQDIALDLVLRQGVLTLKLAKAALYQGTAKGTITVDGSGSGAGIVADVALDSVNIDTLVTAVSGASRLEGKANLALNLRGNGASERAIIGSLDGNGSIKVEDGAVKGVNIAQLLRDAKKGFLFGESTTKSTDFTELNATFTVAQGTLTNKDLLMKSPALRLTGAGTVNLPGRSLRYKLTPTIAGTSKGQGGKDQVGGLAVPLMITGLWNNPAVTPDVAGMVQEGLKNPEALKQNLKDIKSQIKNINSPKDIGRALFGGGKKEEAAPSPAPAAAPAQ